MHQKIAFVLAAGFGKRLKPYTNTLPKPLIPVAGVEPLYFVLFRLKEKGFTKIIVNVHHLAEQIISFCNNFQKDFPGLEIRIQHEKQGLLGTGGSLVRAIRNQKDWFQEGSSLLTLNADVLSSMDFEVLCEGQAEFSKVALSKYPDHLRKYSNLYISKGFYSSIHKNSNEDQEAAHMLCAHYLSPRAVQLIAKSKNILKENGDLFNLVYRFLKENHERIKAHIVYDEQSLKLTDFWFDMGTMKELLLAQKELLQRVELLSFWESYLLARHPQLKKYKHNIFSNVSLDTAFLTEHIVGPVILNFGMIDVSYLKTLQLGPNLFYSGDLNEDRKKQSLENAVVVNDAELSV